MPHLLVESALVEHGVLEVDAGVVAGEPHIVTNCADPQIQLPLGALHHGAAGLRFWVGHLHRWTSMVSYNCELVTLSLTSL